MSTSQWLTAALAYLGIVGAVRAIAGVRVQSGVTGAPSRASVADLKPL